MVSAGKIYEASSLIATSQSRVKNYESLKSQISSLKSAMLKVVNLGDSLQGKGANNIKKFYNEQCSIADQWINLIEAHISFFNSISIQMEGKNLEGNTVVYTDFLNENVKLGLENANHMIDQQQDDLQAIFDKISDIMSLSVFSKESFQSDIEHAEKKRTDTISSVDELDSLLLNDYNKLQTFSTALSNSIHALQEATDNNGQASPMYYDAKKYHSNKAYKVQKETEQKTMNYIEKKSEETKAYEIKKQQEQMRAQVAYQDYSPYVAPQIPGKNNAAILHNAASTSQPLGPLTNALKEHSKDTFVIENTEGPLYANALGFEVKAGTLAGGSAGFTTVKSGVETSQEILPGEELKEEASISMASAEVSAKANMDEIEIGAEATLAKYDGGITIPLPFTDDGLFVGGSAALGQAGGSVKAGKSGFKIHLPVGPGVGLVGVGLEIGFK